MMSDLEVLRFYCPEDRAHVDRHARLSKLVGRVTGLSAIELETLWRASLLHEFGRLGFSYRLRDELIRFAERYDLTDIVSRTTLVRRGLLPDWPTPDQVIEAIDLQIARKREALQSKDARAFGRFVKHCGAMGIRKGGNLPEKQRLNLRILFGHDQNTLENIRGMRDKIPFSLDRVFPVVRVFIELLEKKDPAEADERDLLLATILAGVDQVEITNNHDRWARSRRRPWSADDQDERRSWRTLHLTSQQAAGRDATLPSVHSFLVDRSTGRARQVGRQVRDAIYQMVLSQGSDRSFLAIIEEARGHRIPAAEWRDLERVRTELVARNT